MAQSGGGQPVLDSPDQEQREARNRALTDPYANFETEEPEITYTDYLCNKKPTVWQARVLIMFIFFVAGATQSYQGVIILELQEKGASYSDQAKFSIVFYPYTLKLLFAPLLDVYFIKWMGKCKTYTVLSLLVLGASYSWLSYYLEEFNVPSNINNIVVVWFMLNFVACLSLIAAEMLILKSFDTEDDKAKGGMLFEFGFTFGTFFAMNILVPLSDLKWLNSKRAADNQLTSPYMTHGDMLFWLGISLIIFSVIMFVFFGERQIEKPDPNRKFWTILKALPRFFTTKNMRDYLIFLWITKALKYTVAEPLTLKLIDAGLSKTEMINVETVTFPMFLIGSSLIFSWMRKGNTARMYLWMVFGGLLTSIFKFFMYVDLRANHNTERTIRLLYVIVIAGNFISTQALGMAYTNTISQPEFGSSFLTLVYSWWNSALTFPQTLGLKITQWVGVEGFPTFFWINSSVFFVCIGLYYDYTNKLDTMSKEEYA